VSDRDEIRDLLIEIRDNQRASLKKQDEHLAVAREQIDRARGQVQESIELQRQAIEKVKRISRVAVPGIVLCIGLIVYLLVKYF